MKQVIKIFLAVSFVLFFSACSQNKNSVSNPVTDPVGHTADTINLGNKMKNDIQDATDKENERLNNTLNENNNMETSLAQKYDFAVLKTSLGDIKVRFDAANAPKTVENFLKLAQSEFYNSTKFHRVIKGFMIQGGDPLSKDDSQKDLWGTGGPGYTIPAEIKNKNIRGTIATARLSDQVNPQKDSSGSQFFINTVDNVSLDGQYTVFGEVILGMDIVDKIENVATGANDRPIEDVIINSVEVLEK